MEKTEFTQARKKTELLYMLEMMMRNPEAPEEKRNNLKFLLVYNKNKRCFSEYMHRKASSKL